MTIPSSASIPLPCTCAASVARSEPGSATPAAPAPPREVPLPLTTDGRHREGMKNRTDRRATEPLMTTLQVSTYLQVPVATIYDWNHKEVGPRCIKVGRHLRWRRSDVDAWLEKHAA